MIPFRYLLTAVFKEALLTLPNASEWGNKQHQTYIPTSNSFLMLFFRVVEINKNENERCCFKKVKGICDLLSWSCKHAYSLNYRSRKVHCLADFIETDTDFGPNSIASQISRREILQKYENVCQDETPISTVFWWNSVSWVRFKSS